MKALILSLAILVPGAARAADERARVDLNGNPSQLGVSVTTGEIRRIKVQNDGTPIFASTGTTSVSGSTVSVANVAGTQLDVNVVSGTIDAGVAGSTVHVINKTGETLSVDDGAGSLTVDAIDLDIRDLTFAADKVDASGSILGANSGVDIGDVTINNASGASAVNIQDGGNSITIDAVSLPLPTGAATETTLSGVKTGTDKIPSQGAALTAASLPVNIASDQTVPISAAALPLPSGAATSANQATGNTSLSSIDGKLPSTVAADRTTAAAPHATRLTDGTVFYKATTPSDTQPVSDAGGSLTVDAVQLDVDDLTFAADKVDASGSTLGANSGIDIGDVTVNNGAAGAAVNIQDGGNSITIDGTVTANAGTGIFNVFGSSVSVDNVAGTSLGVDDNGGSLTVDAVQLDIDDLTFASDKVDASGSILGANSGVDIGDVTINNASGASAVNIQDGGNVLSVDDAGATLSVDDGGGSITIDGTVSLDDSGNDTPKCSTESVSGSVIEVMAADAGRESSIVTNEGPEIIRCGPAGTLTSAIGQRLLVDQDFSFDGPRKPFRGALSCLSTTGSPTKITVCEAN